MVYQLLDTTEHNSTKKKNKKKTYISTHSYKSTIKYFNYFLTFQITKNKCTLSNNIIAHLIFFPFRTFLILHIQDSHQPHILKLHPHILVQVQQWDNNSTHLTFCFFLFISFFNSLSLSLSRICAVQDARAAKSKP